MAEGDPGGLSRVSAKERNNQSGGRSGGESMKKPGPASTGGDRGKNPTQGGGINRPTRGKSG